MKLRAIIFAAAMLLTAQAQAATCGDVLVTTSSAEFADISIASGAVAADEIGADKWDYATIHFDLTDADNSVTSLQWSYTISDAAGGTVRLYPDCTSVSPTMTCNGQLVINYDPRTPNSKSWAMPFPTKFEWMVPTFTPTGHGAGDTLSVKIRGCWAGTQR